MANIRVIDYNGDFDDLYQVNLIGPFPSEEAASQELLRLQQIAPDGCYDFELTDLSSPSMADPAVFTTATDGESFERAFYQAF